ncbi:endonuclease MutS2 [Calidifontibacillus erzurumensis]|uniref:Endonuclease MutS2 n=1 Tax=Calidifontibacillus erzurumensis TaxID=2741433 RepID=A0A8J8GFM7_9BACI|nr:endonuclease MutS2 [Calidifontibacillus erzurumensis]NSL51543.1 endonuclease MutS2 [Calidifontibacillus erzurumensis]
MNERVIRVLEFDKIKEALAKHATSSLGKEKAENLQPSSNFDEVVKWQEETDEAVKVLRLKGQVPLGGIFDIRASLKRAQIGGDLSASELLDVASTIYAGRQIKNFIEAMVEDGIELPLLDDYVKQIKPLAELERNIKNCIDDHGHVMDGASDKLRTIRQTLRSTESRIREKLENMTRSQSAQKMLSDAIITIRNERFVIPVKQEYRHAYGGIVHDQSASGATLFIEPQVVVDLNNQLQETKAKEKQEIDRILHELTMSVAEEAGLLYENVDILAEIDFIFAKAFYSQHIKASKPKMNKRGIIKLYKARHPLIDPKNCVPNDIFLGEDYSAIVITGPNTGGKTVTLKTIGLLTLMAQAGLQIPALDDSEMTVFSSVFADIGDEQSIEQSLSTFSSHMTNIVEILKHVDENSLVLFDELGAGTDPQEGAALAIAILDDVYMRGAKVVATTHYSELKAYSYNRTGVINASVEFDVETLSPTYKLLLGVPGRSNAFEISKRLGLSERIIANAKNYVSNETNKVENMIFSLEQSQKKAEQEWIEAEKIRKYAEELHHELQQQIIAFNEERNKLLEKAEEEAREAVEKAKKEAEAIIRDLQKMKQSAADSIKEHEMIEARKKLEEAVPSLQKKHKQTPTKKQIKKKLLPGDEVKVISLDQKGHIVEKISEEEFQVQIGILKMKVKANDLEYISSPTPIEKKPLATVRGSDHHVKLELDLRGERYEDAIVKVEKYIDDALLASYPRVSIIHGKGTGALRKGVHEFLKNHRHVKSFRLGEMAEGGSGVTVVELK